MPYLGPIPANAPLTEDQIKGAADNRYLSPKIAQTFTGPETDQARSNIYATRNYVGATAATNNMTFPSTESGRFFTMNLTGGVQTANLPNVSIDGFSIVILATGSPTSYNTSYITAAGSKNIYFRNVSANTFSLIGLGEVFRFTWIVALNYWMAECLVQPGKNYLYRYWTGTNGWNSSPTTLSGIFYNQRSGINNIPYANNGTVLTKIPAIGVYHLRAQLLAGTTPNPSSAGGTIYLTLSAPNIIAQSNYMYFPPSTTAQGQNAFVSTATGILNSGDDVGANWQSSDSSIWYYPDNNHIYMEMISR